MRDINAAISTLDRILLFFAAVVLFFSAFALLSCFVAVADGVW